MSDKFEQHQKRQEKIKKAVDEKVAKATIEKGLFLVITGNGKGKSTAAFGTTARAVGHGQKATVAQFVKGGWECGERNLLENAGAQFYVMSTGFTWETQNRESDTAAAQSVWQQAKQDLTNDAIDLVVLDEITYMINYDYIELDDVLDAIQNRPSEQSVIVTGRAAHRKLEELADTVSEVRNVKHAFDNGIKARKGIDW